MSEPLTVEQLNIKITDIDNQIDKLVNEPEEFSLDTGQMSQRVKARRIETLIKMREYYKRLIDGKTKKAKWGEVNRF